MARAAPALSCLLPLLLCACGAVSVGEDAFEGRWVLTGSMGNLPGPGGSSQSASGPQLDVSLTRAADGNYRLEALGCSLSARKVGEELRVVPSTSCQVLKGVQVPFGSQSETLSCDLQLVMRDGTFTSTAGRLDFRGSADLVMPYPCYPVEEVSLTYSGRRP